MAGPPRSRDGAGTTEIVGRWKRPFGAGPEQAEGSVRLRGHEAPTSPSPASAAQTLLLGSGPHPNEASPSHSYGEGDDQGQVHGCSVPRGQRKALRGGLARPDGARGGRPGRDLEPRVRADLLAMAPAPAMGREAWQSRFGRSEACRGLEGLVPMPPRGGQLSNRPTATRPAEAGQPLGRHRVPSNAMTMRQTRDSTEARQGASLPPRPASPLPQLDALPVGLGPRR